MPNDLSYPDIAYQYANDVLDGVVPACRYVKQACDRFFKFGEREDMFFDTFDVERWLNKIHHFPHIKGKYAGQPFKPKPFQVFIIANIVGWKWRATGKRVFREVYIEVPRKNGKSFTAAPLAIGFLTWDQYKIPDWSKPWDEWQIVREHGAEVFCGATSKDQARKVFDPAKSIINKSPDLMEKYNIDTYKNIVISNETESKMEILKATPGDGDNPSAVIVDEYHEHTSDDLVETMQTGMGAREQPITIYITTAGDDMGGPCYEKRQEVVDILAGTLEDESIFGIIYTVDDEKNWDTIEAFKMANPNWDLMDLVAVEQDIKQARRSARKQNAYKTKKLNIWVGSKEAYFNILKVQACRKKKLKIEQFAGKTAFIGLDLNTKDDIASIGVIIPPHEGCEKTTGFCKHYLPEETIKANKRYMAWYKQGWLTSTPGERTDYRFIEDDIRKLCKLLDVKEIPYDPFNATDLVNRMMDDDLPMIEYGQTMKNLSEPTKEFEAIISTLDFQTDFDPVLLWMFGNTVVYKDQMGNVKPVKENKNSQKKIDGVVALIIGYARAMFHEDQGSLDEFLTGATQ